MSIYYWCGSDKISTMLLRKDVHNKALFLCCPGPSLALVDPKFLESVHTMAINTAYPKIKPNVAWIGMDSPLCYEQNLLNEPFPKFMQDFYEEDYFFGKKVKEYNNTHFVNGSPGFLQDILNRLDYKQDVIWNSNTFEVAISIALIMGYERIYLIGTDFGGKDYYHNLILTNEQRSSNFAFMQEQVDRLKEFSNVMYKNNVELISCTKDSPINDFLPYRHYQCAVKQEQVILPVIPNYRVLHNSDAEKLRYEKTQLDFGVVTFIDENSYVKVDEWHKCLKHYNEDIPVCFFIKKGTQISQQIWEYGIVRELEYEKFPNPFCLLKSPFFKTIFIDINHYVNEPIADWFRLYAEKNIAFISPEKEIVGYSNVHNNPVINDWAWKILVNPQNYDKELETRSDYRTIITSLPKKIEPLAFLPEKELTKEKGVIVYTDESQEWLLKWWYDNFHEHNPTTEIVIGDSGMSDEMRVYAETIGEVIDLTGPNFPKKQWYKKPYLCQLSPFKHTVYMDIDIEVKGSIDELFEIEGLGTVYDLYNNSIYTFRADFPYQSGVLAFNPKESFIEAWRNCTISLLPNGDEDSLNFVLAKENSYKVALFDKKYHRSRMDHALRPDDIVLMHYHGPEGKEIIKQKIVERYINKENSDTIIE